MKRKYIFIIIVCFIIFFLIFYYKNFLNGNTIFKQSEEEIVENILREDISYKSEIKVKVYSNKNENEYIIKQEEKANYSYEEVISSGDISGLIIENKDGKLVIKNSKLNLEKIYEDYKPVMNNCLFLSSFYKEYKESENVKKFEKDNYVVISVKIKNSNEYIKYKELYIDKDTGIPKKMLIKNSDKQNVICIEYTNIEIM